MKNKLIMAVVAVLVLGGLVWYLITTKESDKPVFKTQSVGRIDSLELINKNTLQLPSDESLYISTKNSVSAWGKTYVCPISDICTSKDGKTQWTCSSKDHFETTSQSCICKWSDGKVIPSNDCSWVTSNNKISGKATPSKTSKKILKIFRK